MGCALCGSAPGSSGEAVRLHDSFSGFCGKCGRPGVLSIDFRGTQITVGLAAFAADGRLATGSQVALLLNTLRKFAMVLTYSLLSIRLLRHVEGLLFPGIDVAFPDAQPPLEAV